MSIVKNRKIFYSISLILILASFYSVIFNGLNYGIDFTGGINIELAPNSSTTSTQIEAKKVLDQTFENVLIQPFGSSNFILKTKDSSIENQNNIKNKLAISLPNYQILRFDTIGPSLGNELKVKSLWSVIAVLIAIVLFIAFSFRKVSNPVSSWKYGFAAIIALFHDIIIPIGFFSFASKYLGVYEVDSLFITALLVILGFSIHDTIVVFDRIREKLSFDKNKHKKFSELIDESVSETFVRSINTSLTTIISLAIVYIWGPIATQNFALTLIIGITAGTYSSIFIGSNLLISMSKNIKNK